MVIFYFNSKNQRNKLVQSLLITETYTFLLSDKKYEFRITGNRIENKSI